MIYFKCFLVVGFAITTVYSAKKNLDGTAMFMGILTAITLDSIL